VPAPAPVPLPAPAAAGVGAPPRGPRRDRSPLPPVVRGRAPVGVAFPVVPLGALVVRAPGGEHVPRRTPPGEPGGLEASLLTATSAAACA
jgi:hypothetical protein